MVQDKDKEKERDSDKVKGKEKGSSKGKSGKNPPKDQDDASQFSAYQNPNQNQNGQQTSAKNSKKRRKARRAARRAAGAQKVKKPSEYAGIKAGARRPSYYNKPHKSPTKTPPKHAPPALKRFVVQGQPQPPQQYHQQPPPPPPAAASSATPTNARPQAQTTTAMVMAYRNKTPPGHLAVAKSSISTGATERLESTQLLNRLKADRRQTPEHYRNMVLMKSSPSQLSFREISEYYICPSSKFAHSDDVYLYRGYKKIAKIDEGAFGVVSKAVRLSDRLLVAIKEIDLRKKRAKRVEEMKRELFVLQRIDSPHVVKLIEHCLISSTLVIIMEFCAGGNLTTYLKECSVDEQEASFLFKQMALSIKILHKKGISHRDVKLNNFLLDGSRRTVKIADFGLSIVSFKPAHGIFMAKTYCGTEPYMAPELLKRNRYNMRSYNPFFADIWSLGICLYAMLTRTFPFRVHDNQETLLKNQLARRWKFPRNLRETLTEELKDLAFHLLDPEPERRITITGVLSHPWLNGHDDLVQLSAGETEPQPGERHSSRFRLA